MHIWVPSFWTLRSSYRTYPEKTLYVMWLSNNPTCMKFGSEEEISVHILCECEALTTFRNACLGSFILDSEDITNLSIGGIWKFGKGTGLL
jgi:hypothetical protein